MKNDITEIDLKYTFYKYASVFLVIMLFVNSGNYIFQRLSDGFKPEIVQTIFAELIAVCLFYALIPSIYFFTFKYPILKPNLTNNLVIHIIFSLFLSIVITFLMYIVRSFLWPLFGFGKYGYGILKYSIAMEYFRVLVIYAIFYGGIHWLKSFLDSQKQKLLAAKLEEQLAKAKIETLQMQLNPHFLFNTLNVISATMFEDVNSADKMIADLSDLLRMTLNKKDKIEHTLSKEIEMLKLYIDIMKARFKDKLNYEITYDKSTEKCLVPIFILQPIVENSIQYSTENVEQTLVRINIINENDKLILSVRDSGNGLTEKNNNKNSNGIGLLNTASRLDTLYGSNSSLTWGNIKGGGFEVEITIPYREIQSEKQ